MLGKNEEFLILAKPYYWTPPTRTAKISFWHVTEGDSTAVYVKLYVDTLLRVSEFLRFFTYFHITARSLWEYYCQKWKFVRKLQKLQRCKTSKSLRFIVM